MESSPAKKMKFDQETKLPMYACQRSTPLNHKNNIFTVCGKHRVQLFLIYNYISFILYARIETLSGEIQLPLLIMSSIMFFQDALEILEEHALYRGDVNAEARSLAFRRGSSTLKCLRHRISDENELSNLPHIDFNNASKPGHCKRVIKVKSITVAYSVISMGKGACDKH